MTSVVRQEAVSCSRRNGTRDGMCDRVATLFGGTVPDVTLELVMKAVIASVNL